MHGLSGCCSGPPGACVEMHAERDSILPLISITLLETKNKEREVYRGVANHFG